MDARVKQVPGYPVDALGKPQIGSDPASLYGFGHFIRTTEQLILELFGRGLLSGTTHTCLGQELCQMSVVRALNHPDDAVFSNHRNHGHFLTYTGDALGLVAEIMGREAGVCRGYGGSQHIAHRRFHSNGVQAGMTGIAVGHALDLLQRASDGVVAVMVGDGTLGEGLLYESMNLAAVWGCSVLFVVEHNGIAQTTLTSRTVAGSAQGRGEAFGLCTWRVDDASADFITVVEGVVSQMRGRKGPGLLVIDTKRMGPHSKGDDLRDPQELRAIAERDPLAAMGRRLDPATRTAIETRNVQFLKTVEDTALDSPESRFSAPPLHALRDATPARAVPAQPAEATNVRAALNTALRALLTCSDDVVLLGEDMHEPYGGAFKVTAGLSSEFSERVISTPISEAGVTGAGIGLAMAGRRPIVEIMFADFLTLCMDQIYNHAVKFPGMFADCDVPLVVRSPSGGRRGYGPTHSQSPENLMVSVPGLTVLFGSHRHNVGQLLVDAVTRWPNPVVFLEHKLLYGEKQQPGGYEMVPPEPLDPGAVLFPTLRRGGTEPDVTLIGFGGMLPVLERAAETLERDEELTVEIVAPSLLSPLPRRTLVNLLRDRPRIAVVEESHHEYGVSAELLATLAEAGFRGRAIRLGTAPVPIASARSLERDQLHNEQSIVRRVLEMF
jgi:2-oxoisovalerate dehydrogenase E1 component